MQTESPNFQDESQASDLADKAKREASELAREAGEQVHATTQNMLGSIADQLEEFADQLRRQDFESLARHARDAAERSPELYFVGSVATGFALSRFMKASQRRSRASDEQGDSRRPQVEVEPRQPSPTPPRLPATTISPPSAPLQTPNPRS
jgi:hypothetical protein